MKYLSTFEIAEKWGISPRRILNLIKSGRIPEAKFIGSRWLIPENTKKPLDGRTKAAKSETDTFRCPIFEFKDVSSFNPPLSNDELTLKAVIEAFNGLRFKEAEKLLGDLPDRTENRYIRIAATYCGCMLSFENFNIPQFFHYYNSLQSELTEDFPHKAEMSEYLYEINAVLGTDNYYSDEFPKHSVYDYHPSFLPRFCNLSAHRLILNSTAITCADITAHETNCAFLENSDNVFDLQAIHICLACAYSKLNIKESCDFHFRRALELAEKYGLYYNIAVTSYCYPLKLLKEALTGFPKEFQKKIMKCNKDIHKFYLRFAEAVQINSLYKLLASEDYIYIPFAVQGLTNKEIAERMNVSVGTVGKRYGEIYAMLGVESKNELIKLYNSMSNKIVNNKK